MNSHSLPHELTHHEPGSQADGYAEPSIATALALSLLHAEVADSLTRATQLWRGDDLPLSADEKFHVQRYARLAVAAMSQDRCRSAFDNANSVIEGAFRHAIREAKIGAQSANEDHSQHRLLRQATTEAIEDVCDHLRRLNLPLAVTSAIGRGLDGGQ